MLLLKDMLRSLITVCSQLLTLAGIFILTRSHSIIQLDHNMVFEQYRMLQINFINTLQLMLLTCDQVYKKELVYTSH